MSLPNLTDPATNKIVIRPASQDGQLKTSDVQMFEVLFQHLLDVYFYVKNVGGCWISCNASVLAFLNYSKISDVVGKKEKAFFPHQIAMEIRRDDVKILSHGHSVLNRTEVIQNAYGDLIWVQTNKLPIYHPDGNIIGIMGLSRPISNMEDLPHEISLFSETIAFIRANLAETIRVNDLADVMSLSENQFRRKFKNEFGFTPQQFILRARLQASGHLLRNSSQPIAILASDSGFSDQSYFTKQFKQFFGVTPLEYRRIWQPQ
jgi:PAS domain S-box-containing protein